MVKDAKKQGRGRGWNAKKAIRERAAAREEEKRRKNVTFALHCILL